MRVAVVIPAYQAEAALPRVLRRLDPFMPRGDVTVVDDGSRDGTAAVARSLGVRLVSYRPNRGKGHALREGFAHTRQAEAVVTLDADGQHPPECLPDFLRAGEHADLVCGRRVRTPGMPASRRLANWASSRWATILAGQPVSDCQCGYRLYRRRLIDTVPAGTGRYEFETQILVRAARLGFRLAEVEIPTVYGEEKSHLSPFRDVPRIMGVLAGLTWEAVAPPAEMRRALAHAGARREP